MKGWFSFALSLFAIAHFAEAQVLPVYDKVDSQDFSVTYRDFGNLQAVKMRETVQRDTSKPEESASGYTVSYEILKIDAYFGGSHVDQIGESLFGTSSYFDASGNHVGYSLNFGNAATGYVDLGAAAGKLLMDQLGAQGQESSELRKQLSQMSSALKQQLQYSYVANNDIADRVADSSSRIRQSRAAVEQASLAHVASIGAVLGAGSAENAMVQRQIEQSIALSLDPLAIRSYTMDSQSQVQTRASLEQALAASDLQSAVENFEILKSDDQQFALPKGFNESGILVPEALVPSLPASPLGTMSMATQNPEMQQLVRRVANKYQLQWAESEGLQGASDARKMEYITGLVALRTADSTFNLNASTGFSYLQLAQVMYDVSAGTVEGSVDTVKGTIEAFPAVANLAFRYGSKVVDDPTYAVTSIKNLWASLPRIKAATQVVLAQVYEDFKNAPARQSGRIVGSVVTEVALAYATGGALSGIKATATGGKIAITASAASQKIRNAVNISRRGIDVPIGAEFAAGLSEDTRAAMSRMPIELRAALKEASEESLQRSANSFRLYEALQSSGVPELIKVADEYGMIALKSASLRETAGAALDAGDILRIRKFDDVEVVGIYKSADVNNYQNKILNLTQPPNLSNAHVISISLRRPLEVARFHGPHNQAGRFSVPWQQAKDMATANFDDKLAIPGSATHLSRFVLPASSEVWISLTAPAFGAKGGTLQLFTPVQMTKDLVKESVPLL